jgi:hypothetical protein
MASFAFTGNILGEATNPFGNNLLEAMRHTFYNELQADRVSPSSVAQRS